MDDEDKEVDINDIAKILADREAGITDVALLDTSGESLSSEMLSFLTDALVEAGVLMYDDAGKLRPTQDIPVGKVLSVEFNIEKNEITDPEYVDENDPSIH